MENIDARKQDPKGRPTINMSSGALNETVADKEFQELIEPLSDKQKKLIKFFDITDQNFIKFLLENNDAKNYTKSLLLPITKRFGQHKINLENAKVLYELIKTGSGKIKRDLLIYLAYLEDQDIENFDRQGFEAKNNDEQIYFLKKIADQTKKRYDKQRDMIMQELGEIGDEIPDNLKKAMPVSFIDEIIDNIEIFKEYLKHISNDPMTSNIFNLWADCKDPDDCASFRKTNLINTSNFRIFKRKHQKNEK